MAITETKVQVRPNTSVPFFTELGMSGSIPVFTEVLTQTESLRTAGKFISTPATVSDDGLTQTKVQTFDSLETYSQIDTFLSIALDAAFRDYVASNDFTSFTANPRTGQYTQSGIDQPFTCTTTYTFLDLSHATLKNTLINGINLCAKSSSKIKTLDVTNTTVVAVHQYNNSADFTATHWNDFEGVSELNSAGVTRTIKYELV
jgi:hypothetical protein